MRPPISRPAGPLYRAVWRWHFYAGVLVAPLAIFLAITGGLYLWKPQYEAWRYGHFFNVPAAEPRLPPDSQLDAARAEHPGYTALQFTPASSSGRSAEVRMSGPAGAISVFVDPHTGQVLGAIADSRRLMVLLQELHGSLLAGRWGRLVVELGASWAFVLLATGFYLWWPRPFALGGFLVPRLRAGRLIVLRDLHAVPAVWLSLGTLFLLTTGMQWTTVGGAWARTLAQFAGEWQPRETSSSAHRSELLGGWSPFLDNRETAAALETIASTPAASPAADAHAGHRAAAAVAAGPEPSEPSVSLARVEAIAAARGVTGAYSIALPQGPAGVFSILSDRNKAFSRAYIHLDRYSGKVLADVRFSDFGRMGKFFTFGIIAHEGRLFGLPNQILGAVACLGVILLAATGLALWRSRRPEGGFGAPEARGAPLPGAVRWIALGLAALLPLMAATLVILVVADRLLGPRLAASG